MKFARQVIILVALVLMTGGYIASQVAYWNGSWAEYASKVDTQQISILALLILIAAVVLAFIPDREAPKE